MPDILVKRGEPGTPKPRLKDVSSLAYFICWAFSILNLVIAANFFLIPRNPILELIPNLVWVGVFASLGGVMIYGLVTNRWKFIKGTLLAGLATKSIWAYTLAITTIQDPGAIGVFAIWLTLSFIQACTFIFFTPRVGHAK